MLLTCLFFRAGQVTCWGTWATAGDCQEKLCTTRWHPVRRQTSYTGNARQGPVSAWHFWFGIFPLFFAWSGFGMLYLCMPHIPEPMCSFVCSRCSTESGLQECFSDFKMFNCTKLMQCFYRTWVLWLNRPILGHFSWTFGHFNQWNTSEGWNKQSQCS